MVAGVVLNGTFNLVIATYGYQTCTAQYFRLSKFGAATWIGA
jgi:hypothetical protein